MGDRLTLETADGALVVPFYYRGDDSREMRVVVTADYDAAVERFEGRDALGAARWMPVDLADDETEDYEWVEMVACALAGAYRERLPEVALSVVDTEAIHGVIGDMDTVATVGDIASEPGLLHEWLARLQEAVAGQVGAEAGRCQTCSGRGKFTIGMSTDFCGDCNGTGTEQGPTGAEPWDGPCVWGHAPSGSLEPDACEMGGDWRLESGRVFCDEHAAMAAIMELDGEAWARVRSSGNSAGHNRGPTEGASDAGRRLYQSVSGVARDLHSIGGAKGLVSVLRAALAEFDSERPPAGEPNAFIAEPAPQVPDSPGWCVSEVLARRALASVRAMATQPYGFRDLQEHNRLTGEALATSRELVSVMEGGRCTRDAPDDG